MDAIATAAATATAPGLRRAAVLILALGDELGARVLAGLERDHVERLSAELARLGPVDREEREAALEAFYRDCSAGEFERGDLDFVRSLLERTLKPEDAERILHDLQPGDARTPFKFLNKVPSQALLASIREEHAQTIALILTHLTPSKAAEVLKGLPADKQLAVTRRIATMGDASPETLQQLERGLETRLSQDVGHAGDAGAAAASKILNRVDRATEKSILDSLQEEDPDLAHDIRRRMFVFEDIVQVDDRGLQAVIHEIPPEEWALALKAADAEIKVKIYRNLTDRAVAIIEDEIEYLGAVRLRDVETAQLRIVDCVRRLEAAGQVIIEGRGPTEPMVE